MNRKKMFLSLFLCLTMMLGLFPGTALADENFTGSGTAVDPYLISANADLQKLATLVNDSASAASYNSACYKLVDNLDLSGISWTPIGTSSNPFQGSFDGGDHVISNLVITSGGGYSGLFGKLNGAEIANLGLAEVSIAANGNNVGGIAGYDTGSQISRCYVTGEITGVGGVGGIVGSTHGTDPAPTTIENCYAQVSLMGTGITEDVAGIAGWNYSNSVRIINCYTASSGEHRPIAGWSDGATIPNERIVNTYFDRNLTSSYNDGETNKAVFGKTTEEMKTPDTYAGWDTDIWDMQAGSYPTLKFTPSGASAVDPKTITVTVTDTTTGSQVTNAIVTLKPVGEGTELTLSHKEGGMYSAVAATTNAAYAIWVNGVDTGVVVTQDGTGPVSQAVTITTAPVVPEDPGYTDNGIMSYKELLNGAFDIHGYYGNEWISTTFSDDGYETRTVLLGDATVTVSADFINGGKYVQLSYEVTAGTGKVENGRLGVYADVQVGEDDDSALEVIKEGDRVLGLKMVSADPEGAQFNLYFAGAGGVTDCDTYWFGSYNYHTQNVFNQLAPDNAKPGDGTYAPDYSSLTGADSTFAFSWQGIYLDPGESQTFSVIVGVGKAALPPQFGGTPLEVNIESFAAEKTIDISANVTDAMGETDTLYYSVNDGVGVELGHVEATGNEETITGEIDLSSLSDGTYAFDFWMVNSSGAASGVVTRTIVISGNSITVDGSGDTSTGNFTISASASPAAGGVIDGAGSYQQGAAVTLTATPNPGYWFKGWKENSQWVSREASYGFAADSNRTLVAIFAPDFFIGGDTDDDDRPQPPVIVEPVQDLTILAVENSNSSMSITAVGDQPLSYQWQVNRGDGNGFVNIAGATGENYVTPAVSLANEGEQYRCVVSNRAGSASSPVFTITVFEEMEIPKTGEGNMAAPYVGAMLLGGALVAGVSAILRKRQHNA